MKTLIKISLVFLFIQISLSGYASEDIKKDTLDTPKKVLILTQTINDHGLFYTVIDLYNNEMVILLYGSSIYGFGEATDFKLRKVLRTGIFLDPEQQIKINICESASEKKKE